MVLIGIHKVRLLFYNITHVAMESIGIYWKHIFNILFDTNHHPLIQGEDIVKIPTSGSFTAVCTAIVKNITRYNSHWLRAMYSNRRTNVL